ncbi:hypothetical protein V8C44DRAFT_314859, partial [Trichoderma aethiopicum]
DPLLGCATLPAGFGCLHGPPFFLFFFSCTSPRHVLAAGGTPPSGLPTTTKHLSAYLPTSYILFSSVIFSVLLSRSLIPLHFRRRYSNLLLLLPVPHFPSTTFIHRHKYPSPSHSSSVSGHGSGHGYGHTCISYFVHENNLLRVSSDCD